MFLNKDIKLQCYQHNKQDYRYHVVVDGSHFIASTGAVGSIAFNALVATSSLAFFFELPHPSYFKPSTITLKNR